MVFHIAGYFHELEGGDPSGPSLEESRDKVPHELRPRAAQYLRGGSLFLAVGGMGSDDWFDGTRDIAPLDVRTDGVWMWPSAYAYNVEKYGVGIPQEFLEHMSRQGWIAPEQTEAKMREVADQYYQQYLTPHLKNE